MPIVYPCGRPGAGIGWWRRAMLLATAGGFGCIASVSTWPLGPAVAQPAPPAQSQTPANEALTQAQLEQMLAPIALYPDALLMQILMASTYPLEVVQAKRWLGQGNNASLRGDALATALQSQAWDPAVKSLVPFPDVLNMMNEQLDWTQRLGDAVLAQQRDVMSVVQVLRGRAHANGQLRSGPQQVVTVSQNVSAPPPDSGAQPAVVRPPQEVIVIEPAQANQVHVPAYNPSVVYGPWPYPSYPPAYYPPPAAWGVGSALLTGMAFAGGVALVGSLWGWAGGGWNSGDININSNRYNSINANRSQISGERWRHDVNHRQGVPYRNNELSSRYRGAEANDRAQSREQFRGRVEGAQRGEGLGDRRPDGGGIGDRGGPAGGGGIGDRGGPAGGGGIGDRGGPAGGRGPAAGGPGSGPRGGGANLADRGGSAAQRPAQRPAQRDAPGRPNAGPSRSGAGDRSAFAGVGDGARSRQEIDAASARGRASRTAGPAHGPVGGGGARMAGGGGGGRAAAAPRGGGGGRAAAAPRGGGGGGRGGGRR